MKRATAPLGITLAVFAASRIGDGNCSQELADKARLERMCAALLTYRMDHGSMPPGLTALVGEYRRVPISWQGNAVDYLPAPDRNSAPATHPS